MASGHHRASGSRVQSSTPPLHPLLPQRQHHQRLHFATEVCSIGTPRCQHHGDHHSVSYKTPQRPAGTHSRVWRRYSLESCTISRPLLRAYSESEASPQISCTAAPLGEWSTKRLATTPEERRHQGGCLSWSRAFSQDDAGCEAERLITTGSDDDPRQVLPPTGRTSSKLTYRRFSHEGGVMITPRSCRFSEDAHTFQRTTAATTTLYYPTGKKQAESADLTWSMSPLSIDSGAEWMIPSDAGADDDDGRLLGPSIDEMSPLFSPEEFPPINLSDQHDNVYHTLSPPPNVIITSPRSPAAVHPAYPSLCPSPTGGFILSRRPSTSYRTSSYGVSSKCSRGLSPPGKATGRGLSSSFRVGGDKQRTSHEKPPSSYASPCQTPSYSPEFIPRPPVRDGFLALSTSTRPSFAQIELPVVSNRQRRFDVATSADVLDAKQLQQPRERRHPLSLELMRPSHVSSTAASSDVSLMEERGSGPFPGERHGYRSVDNRLRVASDSCLEFPSLYKDLRDTCSPANRPPILSRRSLSMSPSAFNTSDVQGFTDAAFGKSDVASASYLHTECELLDDHHDESLSVATSPSAFLHCTGAASSSSQQQPASMFDRFERFVTESPSSGPPLRCNSWAWLTDVDERHQCAEVSELIAARSNAREDNFFQNLLSTFRRPKTPERQTSSPASSTKEKTACKSPEDDRVYLSLSKTGSETPTAVVPKRSRGHSEHLLKNSTRYLAHNGYHLSVPTSRGSRTHHAVPSQQNYSTPARTNRFHRGTPLLALSPHDVTHNYASSSINATAECGPPSYAPTLGCRPPPSLETRPSSSGQMMSAQDSIPFSARKLPSRRRYQPSTRDQDPRFLTGGTQSPQSPDALTHTSWCSCFSKQDSQSSQKLRTSGSMDFRPPHDVQQQKQQFHYPAVQRYRSSSCNPQRETKGVRSGQRRHRDPVKPHHQSDDVTETRASPPSSLLGGTLSLLGNLFAKTTTWKKEPTLATPTVSSALDSEKSTCHESSTASGAEEENTIMPSRCSRYTSNSNARLSESDASTSLDCPLCARYEMPPPTSMKFRSLVVHDTGGLDIEVMCGNNGTTVIGTESRYQWKYGATDVPAERYQVTPCPSQKPSSRKPLPQCVLMEHGILRLPRPSACRRPNLTAFGGGGLSRASSMSAPASPADTFYYFGETKNHLRHGWGTLVNNKRVLYEGQWRHGQCFGWYVLHHEFFVEIGRLTLAGRTNTIVTGNKDMLILPQYFPSIRLPRPSRKTSRPGASSPDPPTADVLSLCFSTDSVPHTVPPQPRGPRRLPLSLSPYLDGSCDAAGAPFTAHRTLFTKLQRGHAAASTTTGREEGLSRIRRRRARTTSLAQETRVPQGACPMSPTSRVTVSHRRTRSPARARSQSDAVQSFGRHDNPSRKELGVLGQKHPRSVTWGRTAACGRGGVGVTFMGTVVASFTARFRPMLRHRSFRTATSATADPPVRLVHSVVPAALSSAWSLKRCSSVPMLGRPRSAELSEEWDVDPDRSDIPSPSSPLRDSGNRIYVNHVLRRRKSFAMSSKSLVLRMTRLKSGLTAKVSDDDDSDTARCGGSRALSFDPSSHRGSRQCDTSPTDARNGPPDDAPSASVSTKRGVDATQDSNDSLGEGRPKGAQNSDGTPCCEKPRRFVLRRGATFPEDTGGDSRSWSTLHRHVGRPLRHRIDSCPAELKMNNPTPYKRLFRDTPGWLRASSCSWWTTKQLALFFEMIGLDREAVFVRRRRLTGASIPHLTEQRMQQELGMVGNHSTLRYRRKFLTAVLRYLWSCCEKCDVLAPPAHRRFTHRRPPKEVAASALSIEKLIGSGGYAEVYRGRIHGRSVACKLFTSSRGLPARRPIPAAVSVNQKDTMTGSEGSELHRTSIQSAPRPTASPSCVGGRDFKSLRLVTSHISRQPIGKPAESGFPSANRGDRTTETLPTSGPRQCNNNNSDSELLTVEEDLRGNHQRLQRTPSNSRRHHEAQAALPSAPAERRSERPALLPKVPSFVWTPFVRPPSTHLNDGSPRTTGPLQEGHRKSGPTVVWEKNNMAPPACPTTLLASRHVTDTNALCEDATTSASPLALARAFSLWPSTFRRSQTSALRVRQMHVTRDPYCRRRLRRAAATSSPPFNPPLCHSLCLLRSQFSKRVCNRVHKGMQWKPSSRTSFKCLYRKHRLSTILQNRIHRLHRFFMRRRVSRVRKNELTPPRPSNECCVDLSSYRPNPYRYQRGPVKHRDYEARILSLLPQHPFILKFFGIVETGTPGLLLEVCKRGSLDGWIYPPVERRHTPHWRRMSRRNIVFLFEEVALAMSAIHRHNILHRDLKLSNILVDARGDARVSDFGIATPFTSRTNPAILAVYGNVYYAAPEVLRGDGFYRESDVWSFGVAFWEALTGKLAFYGKVDARAFITRTEEPAGLVFTKLASMCLQLPVPPDVPTTLQALLRSMLDPDWRKRPTFDVISRELRKLRGQTEAMVVNEVESFFGFTTA